MEGSHGGRGRGRAGGGGGAAVGSQQRGEIFPSSYSGTWRDPGDDGWCLLGTAGGGSYSSQLPSFPERAWWGCGPTVKGTPGTQVPEIGGSPWQMGGHTLRVLTSE